jgi:hypothetical protein
MCLSIVTCALFTAFMVVMVGVISSKAKDSTGVIFDFDVMIFVPSRGLGLSWSRPKEALCVGRRVA